MRYEKGRKDTSRNRIMEVAAERFRRDGIAASGLANVMSDAGLTNGAFYSHFQSKADLVRECVAVALDDQTQRMTETIAAGGPELAMAAYLSPESRDNPDKSCALAALLPELARQPLEARAVYAERFQALVDKIIETLPSDRKVQDEVVFGVYSTLVGALQLARATAGTEMSDRILKAGIDAAQTLILARRGGVMS